MTKRNTALILLAIILTNSLFFALHTVHFWRITLDIPMVLALMFVNGLLFMGIGLVKANPKAIRTISGVVAMGFLFFSATMIFLIDMFTESSQVVLQSNNRDMEIIAYYEDHSFLDISLTMDLYEKNGLFLRQINEEGINFYIPMREKQDRAHTYFLGLEDVQWTPENEIILSTWREDTVLNVSKGSSSENGEWLHIQS
ncbi:hypothetical protein [Bacillus sp. Marseille-P3800]|uniref:hypothetical protein n=1 Tax=Bacillus sp. Marseille-P3800 TaxID=2014782 RepID=UPI000C081CBF|nr:hypothetical protein [Bacillus sp. Marseille-P3800]